MNEALLIQVLKTQSNLHEDLTAPLVILLGFGFAAGFFICLADFSKKFSEGALRFFEDYRKGRWGQVIGECMNRLRFILRARRVHDGEAFPASIYCVLVWRCGVVACCPKEVRDRDGEAWAGAQGSVVTHHLVHDGEAS